VAIMLFDLRSFTIPDWLNGSAFCLGLIYAATQGADAPLQAVMLAVGRGLVSAATLFVVRAACLRARGRQGIGLGDVKLAAVAGAWLDWSLIPIALEIAAFAALAIYAVRHLIFRAAMSATTRIPFGAFFAPAIWLCWLTEQIMH
jgi:leader peptidase (prepilin peptidase)/N-methyltransferase